MPHLHIKNCRPTGSPVVSVDPKSLPELTTVEGSRVAIPISGPPSVTHSPTAEDGMSPWEGLVSSISTQTPIS